MPLVSVIIPSYNCASYLAGAIRSVLAQTWQELEIIVVDDGSSDETPAIAASFAGQITYLRQQNRGLPGARNTGIRAASGDFIALLDADDLWTPEKLARQMPLFDDPAVGFVYSDFSVRYADGRTCASYLADRPLASEGSITESYIRSRFLFPSTMVFRQEALHACGLFDEDMLAAEDIELFTRLCLRWQVRRIMLPLVVRTEGTHNITADNRRMTEYTIRAFEAVLRREPQMPKGVRATLHEELARHLWWRGYARIRQVTELAAARADVLRAVKLQPKLLRRCAPYFAASLLPQPLLRRMLHVKAAR